MTWSMRDHLLLPTSARRKVCSFPLPWPRHATGSKDSSPVAPLNDDPTVWPSLRNRVAFPAEPELVWSGDPVGCKGFWDRTGDPIAPGCWRLPERTWATLLTARYHLPLGWCRVPDVIDPVERN
jgi:hypothetical protein